ncbi:MAG: LamG domain-containing protein [Bacteroidetes bacterium]|nr:LamG domain-containing protein [Bacteroidota bacterium]
MDLSKKILFLVMIILIFNYSCKKKDSEPQTPQTPTPTNNTILSLKFNNEISDSSGNKNIMTGNNITYTKDSLGNIKGSAYFDGVTSSITSADNDLYDLKSSFTFSIWIKPETNSAYLIQKQMDINGGGPYSFDYWGGKPRIVLYFNSSDYFLLEGNTPIVANKWQYLAATWDGNSVKIYVDGKLDKDSVLTGKTILNSSKPIGIGLYQWNPTGCRFQGAMDNLEIYKIALSKEAIASKYNTYK